MAERRGEIASQLFAAAQPLMEIATEEPVSVTNAAEASSYGTELIGKLRAGTRLSVVETFFDADGGRRALVVLKGGAAPLGWISLANPADGSPVLRAVHARPLYEVIKPPIVRRRCDLASEEVCRLAVGERLHVIDSADRHSSRRRGSAGVPPVESDGQPQPPQPTTQAAVGAADVQKSQKKPIPLAVRAQDARARPSSAPVEVRMVSASAADEVAAAYERRASELEDSLDESKKSVAVRLGEALVARQVNVRDLVRQWCKRGGEEPISKMEFRQKVRNFVETPAIKAPVPQIDQLFESLDEDRGGSLDPVEMRAALKKLQDAAAEAKSSASAVIARAGLLRDRAAAARKAAEATLACESAEEEILRLKSNSSLDARLGALLAAKAMKISELVAKWDESGDGVIDKEEFQQHVKALGLAADGVEIDRLFDSLDEDGGGSLDATEMKRALRTLQEAAKANQSTIKSLVKSKVDLVRAAKAAQLEMRQAQREDEEAAADEAERAARKAEERAYAAEEARRTREAALAEKKARDAAEKAAFAAKIAAKRGV